MHNFSKSIGSWARKLMLVGAVIGAMHAPSAMAQNTSADYLSIVGPGAQSFNFKDLNRPDLLPVGSIPNTLQISYIAGSSSPDKLKFFMPPGTVMFTANFLTYLSQTEAKGVMRFKEPPTTHAFQVTRDMAFSAGNSGGGVYGGAFNETILKNILAGQEVYFYGDAGAGLMPVSYGGTPISPVPSEGGYTFGRFQYPGGVLGATQWTVFVDKECYQNWYANANWDTSGNPSEVATHTCTGSSGGGNPGNGGTTDPGNGGTTNPGTTLTGISLSQTELTVGAATTLVKITPTPSTATLPSCTVNPVNVLTYDALISGLTAGRSETWKLNGTAAAGLTAPTSVTFTCGAFSSSILINPAGFSTTIATEILTNSTTNAVTLKVTLNRGQAEIAAGGTANYWVAALIPVDGMFFNHDEWFFLTQSGWAQLTLPNPNLVTFRNGLSAANATETFEIPLGFSKAEAAPFKVQIYFGYAAGSGAFRNMGKIWDSVTSN